MRIRSLAISANIGLMILFAQGFAAEAADIKLISAIPMTEVMKELGPQFERMTGHKLVIQYEVSGVFKRKIDAGEPFDVAISTSPVIDDLVNAGRILAATRANVAYAGVGLGVRAGAPKPDISSVEAFKRALLNSNSVAHSREGESGVYFKGLLERLGIAEGMKPKLRPMAGNTLVQAVPRGEAEMIVVAMSVIMTSGAELVGPLPSELQSYIRWVTGVGAAAKEPDAAKELIKFLTAPAAVPVIKAKGMEPAAPQ